VVNGFNMSFNTSFNTYFNLIINRLHPLLMKRNEELTQSSTEKSQRSTELVPDRAFCPYVELCDTSVQAFKIVYSSDLNAPVAIWLLL
jgi:hypothetical protein